MVSVPFRSGCPLVDLTVAMSFGTQLWVLVADEVSVTVTISALGALEQAVTGTPFVFGPSPEYEATKVYVPTAVAMKLPEPYGPSPVTGAVEVKAVVVQLFGP